MASFGSEDRKRAVLKVKHLVLTPMTFAILLSAAVSSIGVVFFFGPETSLVGALTGDWWEIVWALFYAGGAVGALVGLFLLKPNWEAACLILLGCAIAVNIYAVLDVRGPVVLVGLGPSFGVVVGCFFRAYVLTTLEDRDLGSE